MIVDIVNGEIIQNKFARFYFNDMSRLFGLSGTDINVLLLMSKSIGLGNTSMIEMSPKRKKDYAMQLKKTVKSIDNSLKNLSLSTIIKKIQPDSRVYTLDPNLIFSGNDYQRVKIMIEYSGGERKLKVFKNKEELEKYLKK